MTASLLKSTSTKYILMTSSISFEPLRMYKLGLDILMQPVDRMACYN